MKIGRPPKAPKITRICKQCGTKWQAYEWDKNRTDYCSHACFSKSQIGKRRQLVKPKKRACATCGKIFLVGGTGNRTKIAKYCSRTCAKMGHWGDLQHTKARKMGKEERIWFSGFFDGEGCISWPRRTIMHSIQLKVTNTNREVIDWIAKTTGTGRITDVKRKKPQHSAAWTWSCHGRNAQSILRQIFPCLIVKKEFAEIALGIVKATEPPWTQRTKSMRGGMNARTGPEADSL
jgi:hypothetical protein